MVDRISAGRSCPEEPIPSQPYAARGGGWWLERKIPLSLLAASLFQLAVLISWATYLEARVSLLEQHKVMITDLSYQFARLDERMVGMREDLAILRHQLERMENK